MKGVQDFGSVEACLMAINAGVDMFIFREADKKTYETIEQLAGEIIKSAILQKKVVDANERILHLKQMYGIIS